jgi:hypothetical protein
VRWPGGITPRMTATPNKIDTFRIANRGYAIVGEVLVQNA